MLFMVGWRGVFVVGGMNMEQPALGKQRRAQRAGMMWMVRD